MNETSHNNMPEDIEQEADESARTDFERANQEPEASLVAEFIDFLKHNKKWWLLPILVLLLLLALLIILGGTAAAPFIYPVF